MSNRWTVIVFGDSWASYMHPTWPEVLGRRLGAQVLNFAQPGDVAAGLVGQVQRMMMSPNVPRTASGGLRAETLVIVHTGGNDVLMKMSQVLMGGNPSNLEILQANPGAHEARCIDQFLEFMHHQGARKFLVSNVPCFIHIPMFNMVFPMVGNLINSGQLDHLGLEAGDPPELAMQVQGTSLTERFQTTVDEFQKRHPDGICALFDEVEALDELRTKLGEAAFDRQMWDFSMFHPSPFGHEQLAEQAKQCVLEIFPGLSPQTTASVPVAPLGMLPMTPRDRVSPMGNAGYPVPQVLAAPVPAAKTAPSSSLPAAAGTSNTQQPQKEGAGISMRVKTVKGDVFPVSVDAACQVDDLRSAVLASAPVHVTAKGGQCLLAFKGKFLQDDRASISQIGIADGDFLMVVVK